jgi:hypothetical protein
MTEMDRTSALIASLAGDLEPVRRLASPGRRALLWFAAASVAALLLVLGVSSHHGFHNVAITAERLARPMLALEVAGTLLTGILAVIAAFQLSLPDRSPRWALLPLPTLAVWIASSGYSCWSHWIAFGPGGWEPGESAHCFLWIVGVSVPLAVPLVLMLRRARPLAALPVALMAGLGVAALAAVLLQFFHPFDVTFMDLGLHLAAVAIVASVLGASAPRTLTPVRP